MARNSKGRNQPAPVVVEVQADVLHVEQNVVAPKDESKGLLGMRKLAVYRTTYVRATHNGDEIASALDGKDLLTVARVGSVVLGIPADELLAKYDHLNVGQRRMNIGNRIRATVRKQPELMALVTKALAQ